jgi:hypothetical protein
LSQEALVSGVATGVAGGGGACFLQAGAINNRAPKTSGLKEEKDAGIGALLGRLGRP